MYTRANSSSATGSHRRLCIPPTIAVSRRVLSETGTVKSGRCSGHDVTKALADFITDSVFSGFDALCYTFCGSNGYLINSLLLHCRQVRDDARGNEFPRPRRSISSAAFCADKCASSRRTGSRSASRAAAASRLASANPAGPASHPVPWPLEARRVCGRVRISPVSEQAASEFRDITECILPARDLEAMGRACRSDREASFVKRLLLAQRANA